MTHTYGLEKVAKFPLEWDIWIQLRQSNDFKRNKINWCFLYAKRIHDAKKNNNIYDYLA